MYAKVKINELLCCVTNTLKIISRRRGHLPIFFMPRDDEVIIFIRAVKPVGLHEKEKRRSVGRPPSRSLYLFYSSEGWDNLFFVGLISDAPSQIGFKLNSSATASLFESASFCRARREI